MGTELLDLMGIDPDDPRVKDELDDAQRAELLIDTLVELRQRSGLTRAEIAERMETTYQNVAEIERAGCDPRLSALQRYASAVGANLRWALTPDRWTRLRGAPATSAGRRRGLIRSCLG